jgi:hypothetical protein
MFDPARMLVLSAEELFSSPAAELARAQDFLEVEPHLPADLSRHNGRSYSPLPRRLRSRLAAEFSVPNEALFRLIDREMAWA